MPHSIGSLLRNELLGPFAFDVADGLYLEAPFINFCREHHKHVIVVVKGNHRLLLQDAQRARGP